MATHTTNYNWTKPALNDKVNINVLNDNLDSQDLIIFGKANKNDIAPAFDTDSAYTKNDLVYYNGELYQFTADHSAGAWIGTDASKKDISSIIKNVGGDKITYLTHGQIGQGDPPEYITNCPLDVNLTAGVAIAITITDGNNKYSTVQYYSGGEIVYTVGQFNLYVYNDHISLPNYSGSYRNIYCDIIGI